MTTKPTAAAVRAAQALDTAASPLLTSERIAKAATIIDAEFAELVEAAILAKRVLNPNLSINPSDATDMADGAFSALQDALAKLEKE